MRRQIKGDGLDALDSRRELAIACHFETCVNFEGWLLSLDSNQEPSG